MESVFANPARNANVAWWSVSPEELRSWETLEMEYLDLVTSTVRAVEREHGGVPRPVWMYEPGNRVASELMVTGSYTDLICRAAYMNANTEPRAWVRWSVSQAVMASASLPQHPVPMVVLELSADPPDPAARNAATLRLWTRHDAYLSLITGARGILIWSGFRRPEVAATYDFYFDGYASVASDLTGALGLGRVFLFGETRHDLAVRVTASHATVFIPDAGAGGMTYGSVSFAELAYGPSRYLVAVNSANAPVDVEVTGLPAGDVRLDRLFDAVTAVASRGRFTYHFAPYEAVAWRISES